MTIKVLIVDDSATMRALLQARLAGERDIRVVGTAASAREARQKMKQLNPDVVTLDIELPGMDGLAFLEKIMALRPTPVIVVSGNTMPGANMTNRALRLGAVSCFSKQELTGYQPAGGSRQLARMIRTASRAELGPRSPAAINSGGALGKSDRAVRMAKAALPDHGMITVGSSTGGLEALGVLLPLLGEDCPPVAIVQHINARFGPAIVKSLDKVCPAKVQLAEDGQRLECGNIYLAPGGDHHFLVRADGSQQLRARLEKGPSMSGHRPSVDALFHSIAKLGMSDVVGILLTGMGRDGAKGLLALQAAGALTIAEDETSCVVFGMSRAAIALGAAQIIAPIEQIARHTLKQRVA